MSTNGVEREVIDDPGYRLRAIVRSIKRQPNGDWSITVDLKGKIIIDGSRSILLDRQIQVRGFQKGRKKRAVASQLEKQ